MSCGPCSGCALVQGAEANREAHNRLHAKLAVLGAVPFFCHEHLADWTDENQLSDVIEAVQGDGEQDITRFRRIGDPPQPVRVCQSWRRQVQQRARLGLYRHELPRRRACAEAALRLLAQATHTDDAELADELFRMAGESVEALVCIDAEERAAIAEEAT